MMFWSDLKKLLQDPGNTFTLDEPPDGGKPVLTMYTNGQQSNITFERLGNGTNKNAYRIMIPNDDTSHIPWVLAVANSFPGISDEFTKGSIDGEIDVLCRLGQNRIRVPEPFMSSFDKRDDFLFKIKINGEYELEHYVFIEQYMKECKEMSKRSIKEKFFETEILQGDNIGIERMKKSKDCLEAIKNYIGDNPGPNDWRDFQVMYQELTGEVYVMDPERPSDGRPADNPRPLLTAWIDSLDKKIEAEKKV